MSVDSLEGNYDDVSDLNSANRAEIIGQTRVVITIMLRYEQHRAQLA